ncbi:MAG: hypothetical protein AAGB23_05180 [Pseudomonadota bacterium]
MQKVTDQVAHFMCAAAILLVFSFGGLLGGAGAGLGCGLIREVSEAGGSRITWAEVKAHFAKSLNPWVDLAFWALGGVAAALLANWT